MIQQSLNTMQSRCAGAGRLAAALTVGASLMLTSAGCEEEDQSNATIREASHIMAAINAGGGASATAPHREDSYDRIIRMLEPVIRSSDGSAKAAAQVITAQAMAGKGRFEAQRAIQIEDRCSMLISSAHNEADLFAAHSGLAGALVMYDAQPEFDDLQTQTDAVIDEVEAARSRVRGIDDRVAQLRERSDAARDEAATQRRHETELRSEAVSVSAAERRDLIKEAVGYQRKADTFEAEFVMIDAGIEQLERTRTSVQADLDRLVTQRTLLEEADRNAQHRAQVSANESQSAETAAFEAARRLRGIVREIETLRTTELGDAYAQAQSTIDGASATLHAGARADTSREGKSSNDVNSGLIHQSLGKLHKSRATGAAGYAALLARLVETEPALPDRNDYLGMLDRAETDRDEALAAAQSAFGEAADALESARGSEKMQSRIQGVVTSMRGEASEGADGEADGFGDSDEFDG